MTFRARQISPTRPADQSMGDRELSVGAVTHELEWLHQPSSCVPWKTRKHGYSVGVNFHGMFQAIRSFHQGAEPIGPAQLTPADAKALADAHWAKRAAA